MDRAGREHVLVERPSDGCRKYIGIVEGVSLRVRMKHSEKSIEVVRSLVNVEHED
jgi:hypothetical protein